MNYVSFGNAQSWISNFQLRCTNQTACTLALDAGGGNLLGLNYTLGLSAPSGTGTGASQAYTVNGAIAAGQSGVCSGAACSASETRVLTLSY